MNFGRSASLCYCFRIPLYNSAYRILDLFFCQGRKATLKSRQDSFMVPYRRSVNPWGIVFLLNRPPMRCDAFIMAECYNGEPVFWMWNTVGRYRDMLPDSTRLVVEFDNGDMPQSMPQSDILDEFEKSN